MLNKGAIRLFSILFVLVCVYHLSFTFFTNQTEDNAKEYAGSGNLTQIAKQMANGNEFREKVVYDSIINARENFYLDSISNEVVYNILVRKYTYKECKERELNLGLDLKGGMNVTMEVSVPDIIVALSGNSADVTFNKSMKQAVEMQKSSQKDFVTLFFESFNAVKQPGEKLAAIFATGLKEKVSFNTTDEEVIAIIRAESESAIDRAFQILRTRIDQFGVAQPNIQKTELSGRIMIELPGVKDPSRVRKLLQGTAQLEFWTTYEFSEVYQYLEDANSRLKSSTSDVAAKDTAAVASATTDTTKSLSLIDKAKKDTSAAKAKLGDKGQDLENPLYSYLKPAFVKDDKGSWYPGKGPVVGYAAVMDTFRINRLLAKVNHIFPRNLKFAWTVKPVSKEENILQLIALKASGRDGSPALEGDVIADASQDFGQKGDNEVLMRMTTEGSKAWKRITADNVGKSVAIVLDNYVYSFPTVREEIPNGSSSISGNFTVEEAKDLANILGAGKLPAPVNIVEEALVGPSLGQKAINAGVISFILAFILILAYMTFYYNIAGLIAAIAIIANMFFLFGVLSSLQAVLTLPGIAGIILTIGMGVDANVIIFERIREELRTGKGMRLAITDGFKHAYSAIIDGNATTIITGIVLFVFGSGPVKGFAITLIIGILTSLFAAIFLTRLIFVWMMDNNKTIKFENKTTANLLQNVNVDWMAKRKIFYFISAAVIIIGLISNFTIGLKQGIDFAGGRTYVVKFDQDVKTDQIRKALTAQFGTAPEVKSFGSGSQVKVTTTFLIDEATAAADSTVESRLYNGVAPFFKKAPALSNFHTDNQSTIGLLSTQKVGPTIADDIQTQAIWAVIIAIFMIFIYIAIRFKRWQYGIGGVAALVHDALTIIASYSIFYMIVPFDMEVDQTFIAAILTIIGYSINDSVIIFDRIREYITIHPKRSLDANFNGAINSTLGRTLNTAGTTLAVLIILFIFGGEVIRGFIFALLIGISVGTYSSIFISAAVAYDFSILKSKKKEI